ncbi:MAG TPA: AMP-dependent synthetase/ligase [Kofleriaceae bacterium]|nr:AMP-dependent synthetase/ligase [Kofleriaceae bacterium]
MDVSHLLEVAPAPRAVFDQLATHRHRVRFQVRRDGAPGSWQPVTWGDFAREIRGVARWLVEPQAERGDDDRKRGGAELEAGERVAIYAQNSVEWAAAALGVQTAGAVFVPIYPASTAEQVAYILEHAEIRYVFVDPASRGKPGSLHSGGAEPIARLEKARALLPRPPEVVLLDAATWRDAAARDAAAPTLVDARLGALELDLPGMMLYTSGTSGNPKGVPLTHRNVGVNGADWLRCNAPKLAEGDRDLLWLPMSHIFGWGELCAGNLLGWETYLATPADVLDLMPGVAPQVFMSVPAYWEKIARAIQASRDTGDAVRRVTGGRLRFCLSGGAGLKVEIKQLLHDHGVLIIEGYGLTETSPTLTLNRADAFRFDSVGKPVPSVELKLDTDGEILARGPSVFAGYFKDPGATAAAFTDDGWFRTGDVGRWTDDGFLQIVDRKKDILVTAGGKNVPPANIEARFADDPVIERVVVYGDARPYLVAAVWARAEVPADERARLVAARVDAVNSELARHETIKRHFVAEAPLSVDDGTLTTSLKLRRKIVYDRLRDRFEALYG